MEYVLTVNKLTKKYHKFTALDELEMHIPKGSIYGFVGKNGSGKTTLIRIICGLQSPTNGGYTIYGTKNTSQKLNETRRRMGAIVETPAFYLNMTAKENIKEQYRILGKPDFSGVDELLKLVGLSDTGNKKAGHFSLGMRQRLGIAMAIASNPDFLVLDEPTNGLDPEGIIEIREVILKLNRERNITVLISSHILDELSRLATHYGFIDRGKMIKEISADDLENVCRKCMHVTVSDTKVLSRVLDKMNIEYEITSDNEADIFHKMTVTSLVNALSQENCELISLKENDESLESYYINLVGGDNNA